MRILHYTLGLPPYRSGGLTKYSTDLLMAQHASGDRISLLYPGDYTFWKIPKIAIIRNESFNGVSVFEIKNPTIVPLRHGISHPNSILKPSQTLLKESLEQFYQVVKPDVMHIHTLMGLPPELLNYLKEKGVKILFTSHDYFGLCLKVNFVNQKGLCCDMSGKIRCAVCNYNAPSSLFLRLRNSSYLLKYKKKLASGARKLEESISDDSNEVLPSQNQIEEYGELIDFYINQFKQIDFFHFNSSVTKEVYEKYLVPKASTVLSISHADIADHRKLRTIDTKLIRLGFIGSNAAYKGFPMLKEVLCKLNQKGLTNWSLQVWGGALAQDSDCDQITFKGTYSSAEMDVVFNQMDLLIVPSIWNETFSLITLEALSHGVPVLASTNVGAKDIATNYNPEFIFYPSKEALQTKLETILSDATILEDYNNKICAGKFEYFLNDHVHKIKQLYINLLGGK